VTGPREPEEIRDLLREVSAPPGVARWREQPVASPQRRREVHWRLLPTVVTAAAVVVALVASAALARGQRALPPEPALTVGIPTPTGTAPSSHPPAPAPTGTAPAGDPHASGRAGRSAGGTSGGSVPATGTPGSGASAWPGPGNTGVPRGTALRTHTGDLVVTTPGTVVQALLVTGTIVVRAPNVTIRSTRITPAGHVYWAIKQEAGATNLRVQDSEITGNAQLGISQEAAGLSVSRTSIHDVEQAVAVDDNCTIADSYLDRALVGVISQGGASGLTVTHSRISVGTNGDSAIALYTNYGPQARVTLTGNLLAGGQYTLYGGGSGARDIRVTGNHFSRAVAANGGVYGPVTMFEPGLPGNTWTGNVWDGTSQPVDP
jgi:hypothetical protein